MNFILILTLICIDNTCESFNFRYSLIKRTVLSRVFPLLVNLAKRPSVKQVKVTGAIRFDHPGKRLSDLSGGNNNMFIAVFCNKTPSLNFIFLLPSWFHRIAVPPLLIYCSRVNITALYLSI